MTPPRMADARGRRLVIHVGPHKTASTYLQENLRAADKKLARAGWHYPIDPVDARSGHHGLAMTRAEYLPPDGAHHGILQAWATAARNAGAHVILSAEGFCSWKTPDFNALADILGFEHIELVYVIRDSLDVFPSLWAEEVKHGRTLGFADRFAKEFLRPMHSRILNPLLDLKRWTEDDRISAHTMPFDLLQRQGLDFFVNLTRDILDVPGLTPKHTRMVNQKTSLEITEFLRLLTLMHYGAEPHNGPDLRIRFREKMTPALMAKIESLMQEDAADARRSLTTPANLGFQKVLELSLKKDLIDHWSVEIPQGEPLFSRKKRVFDYYNEYLLSRVPAVTRAAEDMLRRMYG